MTHLHPARPEHLRRGTPVDFAGHCRGVVVDTEDPNGDGYVLVWWPRDAVGVGKSSAINSLWLDLRDPTARAHAAWAYTEVEPETGRVQLREQWREAWREAWIRSDSDTMFRAGTLLRMRALDETVTPAEASAALLWAEGVQ